MPARQYFRVLHRRQRRFHFRRRDGVLRPLGDSRTVALRDHADGAEPALRRREERLRFRSLPHHRRKGRRRASTWGARGARLHGGLPGYGDAGPDRPRRLARVGDRRKALTPHLVLRRVPIAGSRRAPRQPQTTHRRRSRRLRPQDFLAGDDHWDPTQVH